MLCIRILMMIFIIFFGCVNSYAMEYKCVVLNNGLNVCVVPYDKVDAAYVSMWYRVGGREDPEGQTGIAHFLEHMMFRKVSDWNGNTIMATKYLENKCGVTNAFTSEEMTGYYSIVPTDDVAEIIDFEAMRMTNLIVNGKTGDKFDLDLERSIVLKEKSFRLDNVPLHRLYLEVLSPLYTKCSLHGNNVAIIGTDEDINRITFDDIYKFYRNYYDPSNATMLVIGNVLFDDVIRYVKNSFGSIDTIYNRDFIKPSDTFCPKPKDVKFTITLNDENVHEKQFMRFYRVKDREDSIAYIDMEFMSHLLGAKNTGFLYNNLLKERKIITSLEVSYTKGIVPGESVLIFYATPADGISLENLSEQLDAALLEFIEKDTISPEIIDGFRGELLADFSYSKDGLRSLGEFFGNNIVRGYYDVLHFDSLNNYLHNRITKEYVLEQLHDVLSDNSYAQGYLLTN